MASIQVIRIEAVVYMHYGEWGYSWREYSFTVLANATNFSSTKDEYAREKKKFT